MSIKPEIPLLVLCGGEATRLKKINASNVPKILLKKDNRYFLEYLLLNIKKKKINDIHFLCDNRIEEIKNVGSSFASKYKLNCNFIEDGPIRLGTGGAIKNLCKKIKLNKFHLTFGDSLTIFNHKLYNDFIYKNPDKNIMTVYLNKKSLDQKNIKIKNDRIINYKKNSLDDDYLFIDYGFMTFCSSIFLNYKKDCFDLSDIIMLLIKDNLLLPFYCDKRFYEIGTPKSYNQFQNLSDQKLKSLGYI